MEILESWSLIPAFQIVWLELTYPEVDVVFLEYSLEVEKLYLNSIATQSAQKNINLEKLNPLLIALPKLSEQKKIAEILSSLDEKLNRENNEKNKLGLLKKGINGR